MMLAARGAFLAARRNRAPTAKSYVQDGLVAMWDGIENAGWGVHDEKASTWKDLVGTHDMIVQRGSWGDCYFEVGPQNNANPTLAAYCDETIEVQQSTFEMVGVDWQSPTDKRVGFYFSSAGNKGFLWFIKNDANTYRAQFAYRGYVGLLPKEDSHAVHTVAGVTNGTQCTAAYVDARLSATTYTEDWMGSSKLGIGRSSYANPERWPTGRRYSIRIYNRALTAEEVAHNHAVDKARFNLPQGGNEWAKTRQRYLGGTRK